MSQCEATTFRAHPKTPNTSLTNHNTVANLQNCEDTLEVYMDVINNRNQVLRGRALKMKIVRRRLECYAFQLRMVAPIQIAVNVLKMHKPQSEVLMRYHQFENTSR